MSDLKYKTANARFAAAFTLMELMVSIAILVVIILSVGVIFGGASRSVSVSQATMEMMSNVRAVQQLVERDVSSIDKSTFLVIRSLIQDPNTAPIFPATNTPARHFDQIAFVTIGSFPSRTGTNAANPFDDTTTAGAAHVWWGQLKFEHSAPVPNVSYVLPDQNAALPLNAPPTGIYPGGTIGIVEENQFALGRHATLLFPGPADGPANAPFVSPAGVALPAYASVDWATPAITGGGDGKAAHITSSRFANAALSPSQLMLELSGFHGSDPFAEATHYCYRFKALASIYDNEESNHPFVSGYYRMHPVALQGVSSFAVDWTDGNTVSTPGPDFGTLRWYHYFAPKGDPNIEQVAAGGVATLGDNYVAVFNAKNRKDWPRALRFTYHVADVNNRLQGGRDFVQVVKLPE